MIEEITAPTAAHSQQSQQTGNPRQNNISSREIRLNGKTVFVDLMENGRGTALKIKERTGGFNNVVIIPADAIELLLEGITQMRDAAAAVGVEFLQP